MALYNCYGLKAPGLINAEQEKQQIPFGITQLRIKPTHSQANILTTRP